MDAGLDLKVVRAALDRPSPTRVDRVPAYEQRCERLVMY